MNGNQPQPENDDPESYVHGFDDQYSALDDLHAEIIDVDDSLTNPGPAIRHELAKAKKAVSKAKRIRMLELTDTNGGGAA